MFWKISKEHWVLSFKQIHGKYFHGSFEEDYIQSMYWLIPFLEHLLNLTTGLSTSMEHFSLGRVTALSWLCPYIPVFISLSFLLSCLNKGILQECFLGNFLSFHSFSSSDCQLSPVNCQLFSSSDWQLINCHLCADSSNSWQSQVLTRHCANLDTKLWWGRHY